MTGLLDWTGKFRWQRPACLAALALIITHIVLSMLWAGHDIHDDSGYMLAILREARNGALVHETVFSQYGPFHAQAWLMMLSIFRLPVTHNSGALGGAMLWAAATLMAYRLLVRRGLSWPLCIAGTFWFTWVLELLRRELAHPKSLVLTLCLLIVSGLFAKREKWGMVIAGVALSALALTKINVGGFALIAIGLSAWLLILRSRWLALAGACLAALLPWLLVRSAWTWPAQALIAATVSVPTVMIAFMTLPADASTVWHRLRWLIAGGAVAGIAILGWEMLHGLHISALMQGILWRPLNMPGIFAIAPFIGWQQVLPVTLSALLGVLWFIPTMRDKSSLWRAIRVLNLIAWLAGAVMNRSFYDVGLGALLWLPLTGRRDSSNPFATTAMLLLAVWQNLTVFPVFGAQASLPHGLGVLALLMIELQAPVSLRMQTLVIACAFGMAGQSVQEFQRRYAKDISPGVAGAEWCRWPVAQSMVLRSVAENLKSQPGPVFSLHGQCSFTFWANKPFVNGLNCTFLTGLFSTAELDELLRAYEHEPAWCAVIYSDGSMFGKGPHFDRVKSWIAQHTRPWLMIGKYELRLGGNATPRDPVDAVFRNEAGVWTASIPSNMLEVASVVRLQIKGKTIASATATSLKTLPTTTPGFVSVELPDVMAIELQKRSDFELRLYDQGKHTLGVLPVIAKTQTN